MPGLRGRADTYPFVPMHFHPFAQLRNRQATNLFRHVILGTRHKTRFPGTTPGPYLGRKVTARRWPGSSGP
jgi:hypothetical protein